MIFPNLRKAARGDGREIPGSPLNRSNRLLSIGVVGSLCLCLCCCAVQDINLRNTEAHAQAGFAAEKRGDWDMARRQFAQAVVNADLGNAQPLAKAPVNYQYGRALGVVCSWEMAEKYLLRSKQFVEDAGQSPYLPVLELALLNEKQGRFEVAASHYAELLPLIDKEHLQAKFPLGVADIYDRYADALDATGRPAEAGSRRSAAQAIRDGNPDAKPIGSRTPYGSECSTVPKALQKDSGLESAEKQTGANAQ